MESNYLGGFAIVQAGDEGSSHSELGVVLMGVMLVGLKIYFEERSN